MTNLTTNSSVSSLVESLKSTLGPAWEADPDGVAGDRTNLGLAVQQSIRDGSFLAAGEAMGTWFSLPEDTIGAIESALGEAERRQYIAALQTAMDRVNEFLRRGDLSNEDKQNFLEYMLGADVDMDDDFERDSAFQALGPILSEAMAGGAALFDCDDVDLGEIINATASLSQKLPSFADEYDVAIKPDEVAAFFQGRDREVEERRRRRASMTPEQLLEDMSRSSEEARRDRERAMDDLINGARRSGRPA